MVAFKQIKRIWKQNKDIQVPTHPGPGPGQREGQRRLRASSSISEIQKIIGG